MFSYIFQHHLRVQNDYLVVQEGLEGLGVQLGLLWYFVHSLYRNI